LKINAEGIVVASAIFLRHYFRPPSHSPKKVNTSPPGLLTGPLTKGCIVKLARPALTVSKEYEEIEPTIAYRIFLRKKKATCILNDPLLRRDCVSKEKATIPDTLIPKVNQGLRGFVFG
jgi:hypothetical protein